MAKLTDVFGRPHSGVVPYAVVGIVNDNVDPDKLGRVRVSFPTLVDQPVSFGTLVIRVGACHRRPPDDPPDSAAWLEIRDTRPGAAEVPFRGWMFAASPGLSMLEHAVYDIRVLACR